MSAPPHVAGWAADLPGKRGRSKRKGLRADGKAVSNGAFRPFRHPQSSDPLRSCVEVGFGEGADLIEVDAGRALEQAEAGGSVGARQDAVGRAWCRGRVCKY